MKVLITKQNQDYFLSIDKSLKFEESTVNTCTFNVSEKKFVKIRDKVRADGHNPYAAMSW